MMRPDAKVEKVYLYPKPVDFRKSIDGLAALVELDIKVAVFDPVLFVFLNRHRNRVKILYWERNGFCLWLKRLESERFKTSPDETDEAIVLRVFRLRVTIRVAISNRNQAFRLPHLRLKKPRANRTYHRSPQKTKLTSRRLRLLNRARRSAQQGLPDISLARYPPLNVCRMGESRQQSKANANRSRPGQSQTNKPVGKVEGDRM
ncbi:Uncharacterized protein ALO84_00393 [Pseudomonas syringae pv. maculicola]|nr:Uncharacterized protein ALO84_00393 [Pseudomonas syringae pv. maculicola]